MTREVLWLEWDSDSRPGRIAVESVIRAGRSPSFEIPLLADPYASREPTIIEPFGDRLCLDARATRNGIFLRGMPLRSGDVTAGEAFTLGSTMFHVVAGPRQNEDTMDFRGGVSPVFRRSVRELSTGEGRLIAQFSQGEATAFHVVAAAYPNLATHDDVGVAVWGTDAYDRYQVHRLLQRVRVRMGAWGESLSNVRGAGYRMSMRVQLE